MNTIPVDMHSAVFSVAYYAGRHAMDDAVDDAVHGLAIAVSAVAMSGPVNSAVHDEVRT